MPHPATDIALQIMWNRLIAVVEEQAQALLRTAFWRDRARGGGPVRGRVRPRGAHARPGRHGHAGHVNTMAAVGPPLPRPFPIATMRPGDVFVTNDPWYGTGHLFDFVIVTPVFRRARGRSACSPRPATRTDVGGVGFSAEARSVYEEGRVRTAPPAAEEGVVDESLRDHHGQHAEPDRGARRPPSLIACNDVGCRRGWPT